MQESDRDILIRLDERTAKMHDELLGAPGREGRIPKVEAKVETHGDQIAFWRGAIWIIGGLLVLLGGALAEHIHAH